MEMEMLRKERESYSDHQIHVSIYVTASGYPMTFTVHMWKM